MAKWKVRVEAKARVMGYVEVEADNEDEATETAEKFVAENWAEDDWSMTLEVYSDSIEAKGRAKQV